jgi:mono/diheme cytochrome c family protein
VEIRGLRDSRFLIILALNSIMKFIAPSILVTALLGFVHNASAVDYARQIAPILNQRCGDCHKTGAKKPKGDFAINRIEDMQKQVKAGEPQKSSLLVSITLPEDDEDVMPPKGKGKVTTQEIALIRQWIQEGASFAAGGAPPAPAATPAAPVAAAGPQKWKNSAGTEIEATFEGMDGTEFVLLKVVSTGVVHKVPLTSLSPESQTLAKNGGK